MSKWIILIIFLFSIEEASASACTTPPLNLISDISWQCTFPIRIGGVVSISPNEPDTNENTMNPICICSGGTLPRVGVSVSFWEPARIIDTVSEPYCMMPLGSSLGNPTPGKLGGSLGRSHGSSTAFQQMHNYTFPAWAIMDMFTDIECTEETQFGIAMMTEIMPTWNNEILSLIVNPESVLFANPASQLACAADASAALMGSPRNELFWCMGSWGSAYPLAGSITATDYVEANAGLAARSIFLMGRTGLLRDTGLDGCSYAYAPIWRKNKYKLQLMRPVRDNFCHKIGKTGMLWTEYKQPPQGADNFMWMMFRKVNCCVTYN